MKITLECTDAGNRIRYLQNNNGQPEKTKIYYAAFAAAVNPNVPYGNFNLESFQPLHYKPGQKYDFLISEHTNISVVPGMPKNLKSVEN